MMREESGLTSEEGVVVTTHLTLGLERKDHSSRKKKTCSRGKTNSSSTAPGDTGGGKRETEGYGESKRRED